MAGDWIKMRTNLRDDPTVDQLGEIMAVDDLTVIGMLFAFWAWADEYAVDGRVDGATSRLVTRKVREGSNFADAMVKVGWLKFDAAGATIPNFDRHNGDSAKERSLKNQRQKRWRAGKNVDDSVDSGTSTPPSTGASTRGEERRVHKSKSKEPPLLSPSKQKAERGTRLLDGWMPDNELILWAREHAPGLLQIELPKFCDYWRSQPGQRGVKLDWPATFRNWLRKANESRGNSHGTRQPRTDRKLSAVEQVEQAIRERDDERQRQGDILEATFVAIDR